MFTDTLFIFLFLQSSFKSPYKVKVLKLSTDDVVRCVSLDTNQATDEEVKDDETDPEKEDEQVAYERRQGCEQFSSQEGVSEVMLDRGNSKTQYKSENNLFTESHTARSQNLQKGPELAQLDWHPKSTTTIISTPSKPLESNNRLNNPDILTVTTGNTERPKEQEKSEVNVNLFSLTLRGQREEQQEETVEENNIIHLPKNEPLVPSCSLSRVKTTTDEQTSNRYFLPSDEEEDEEEEEDYLGYMRRN